MQLYVLGFLFDRNEGDRRVLLIRKNRPEFQKGLFNGLGGKVEPDEDLDDAMVREFKEESGVETTTADWERFAILRANDGWCVYCYRSFSKAAWNGVDVLNPPTDESIWREWTDGLQTEPQLWMPNLQWLIPLALDRRAGKSPLMTTVDYPANSQ